MRTSSLKTNPATLTASTYVAVDSFPPSAGAEILTQMDGAPSAAFYRGLSRALVPALLFWTLLFVVILLLA